MARFACITVFVLCALASCVLSARTWNRRRWMIRGRPYHGLMPEPIGKGRKVTKATLALYSQHVDHLGSNPAVFDQRYWWSDLYYKTGGPAFLMLGGEGPASSKWIEYEDIPFFKMARVHNAIAFVLEHRYYGASQPMSDLSTSNLKYLSSRQALEDVAEFIKAMTQKFNLQGAKWITFGGSYSGALSGWMRLKYPDLVYGAIATSAPVLAEVDFTEYMEVVQTALQEQSAECAKNVAAGFAQVQQLMATYEGRKRLQQDFQLCDTLEDANDDDIKTFYESIMGNYMGVVQYGGDNAGSYRQALTVEKLCSFHLNPNVDPVGQLSDVNSYLMPYWGEDCVDFVYQDQIKCMKQTSTTSTCASDRAWIWQTCTEFGYYQTTNSKTAGEFFGRTVDLSWFTAQCEAIYGSQYNNASIFNAVNATNLWYGGNTNFGGSNVVFPNGSWDPWHTLGILLSKYPNYVTAYMKGTAHCADMYEPLDDDLETLKLGREIVEFNVATWMNQ